MREIALDTETTGLNPLRGDRIVEIGCIEMVNHVATGEKLQFYINPERDMSEEAFKVHGLSADFLADKPVFADVVERFLAFIGEARLVIHNAEFDLGFINAELDRLNRAQIPFERAVDTVSMARKKYPGSPANLDALCRRFQIDNSNRTLHGALLDAELLAEVYLELRGGRQQDLGLVDQGSANPYADAAQIDPVGEALEPKIIRKPRVFSVSEQELRTHKAFVEKLDDPIWLEN